MSHRLSHDQSTVVSREVEWLPFDENTPFGAKVWALTIGHVGVTAHLTRDNLDGYLGWYPIPKEPAWLKGKGLGYVKDADNGHV